MTFLTRPVALGARASALTGAGPKRRDSSLLAAAGRRQGRPVLPVLPVLPYRRALPSAPSASIPTHPHCTPVPTPAHLTPRAVRVRRSPR